MAYTAIFGGTFNPPHIGHYEMLSELNGIGEIGEIWITPTRIPPHKVCDFLADDSDRIEMCRRLSEDFNKARLCLEEFERPGKSYTYDTVTLLKQKYPDRDFAFVCGGDMITTFEQWHKYGEIMHMLPFFVFRRVDVEDSLFDKKIAEFREKGMRVTVLDKKISAVSSTFIRNNIDRAGGLLPEKIYDYIIAGGIYNAGK